MVAPLLAGLLTCAVMLGAAMPGARADSAPHEPPPGSELRADLLDALRPILEWRFGAPVEIVVQRLQVAGDLAFASVRAQRPGGGRIDLRDTPIVLRDGYAAHFLDGPTLQALLQRSGRMWVAVRHEVGATEMWFVDPAYCPVWGALIGDVCR